jgi:hypothetical protein
VPLFWPDNTPRPQFDDSQEKLTATCEGRGYLRLGAVEPGVGYRLQVGVSQTRWTGGLGLFFGYHTEPGPDGPAVRFQQLTLLLSRGKRNQLHLSRSRGALAPAPEGDPPTPKFTALLSQDLPVLSTAPEHLLEVEVSAEGLVRLARWDNTDLAALCHEQAMDFLTPRDGHGDFGLFLDSTTGTFSRARILILNSKK